MKIFLETQLEMKFFAQMCPKGLIGQQPAAHEEIEAELSGDLGARLDRLEETVFSD